MYSPRRLRSKPAVLFTALVGAGLIAGCRWVSLPAPTGPTDSALDPAAAETSEPGDGAAPSATAESTSNTDRAVLAQSVVTDHSGRQREIWVQSASPQGGQPEPCFRWTYAALEELVARPATRRPDFAAFLGDSDAVVATNAAIALARLDNAAGLNTLAAAAANPQLGLPIRRASIEALASLPNTAAALESLLEQYGDPSSGYHPDLHAELIRGLGYHVDPTEHPAFQAALDSRSPQVRLEAVRSWTARGDKTWTIPDKLLELQADRDPRIRAAVLAALARNAHPRAAEILGEGLKDCDFRVRLAAVAALGELGSEQAVASLNELLEAAPERVRAAAVVGLNVAGARQAVLAAAEDESWRVRREVALALASMPGRDAHPAAEHLLDDTSTEVRHAVVAALTDWPLEQAGPMLLTAMQADGYLTRSMAAEQLADRWAAAARFPVDGTAERRAEVLAELQTEFVGEFGRTDPTVSVVGHDSACPEVSPEQLACTVAQIEGRDVAGMAQAGAAVLPALEALVLKHNRPLPDWVFQDVLPDIDPVFAELDRLDSKQLPDRRRAAGQLAQLASREPLSPLALARLHTLIIAEPDQLTWQGALRAVARDSSRQAAELACAGLGHPSPEVRRRACDHLAAHPDSRYAKALLAGLTERNPSVLAAVVRALGALNQLDDASPLEPLLMSPHENVRFETARALHRLNHPSGAKSLRRLAHHDNIDLRRAVAEAMGERPDPTFLPLLIEMLDDRAAIRRAALDALEKCAGDEGPTFADDAPSGTGQRVEGWKRWAAARGIATRTL